MASSNRASSTWQNNLNDILRLEESRGFDDWAVVGGLDKFIERWSAEIIESLGDAALAQRLTKGTYALMSQEERRLWAQRWRDVFGKQAGQTGTEGLRCASALC